MKRLQKPELEKLLACPECGGELETNKLVIVCPACKKTFGQFDGRPVLLSDANELFPTSAYVQISQADILVVTKRTLVQNLKRLIPKISVNLAREKMFHQLSATHGEKGQVILVVGCGNQTEQLEQHFPGDNTVFVFCDIDKNADADVFCDSHELAFKPAVFDGVISTAVLEHVLYPEKVVSEIYRVLKDDGFLYSEIPFLQSVHEGAYDFTRFTMSGHRRLLEFFKEIDSGMVAGPGTALVWSIVGFFKALSSNRRISSLLSIGARIGFFWLKYADLLLKNNPAALDSASCTYFYGLKSSQPTSATEITQRYEGREFGHL